MMDARKIARKIDNGRLVLLEMHCTTDARRKEKTGYRPLASRDAVINYFVRDKEVS